MCARYFVIPASVDLDELFGLTENLVEDPSPQYNVAPTDPVVAVRELDGVRQGAVFQWGFRPKGKGPPRINAKAETMATTWPWKFAWPRQRCIIPVHGIYEWTGAKGSKNGHVIGRPDGEVMGIAGLWSRESDKGEGAVTMLTTEPSSWWARLHHRQALILHPDAWSTWLSAETPVAALEAMLAPFVGELVADELGVGAIKGPKDKSGGWLNHAPRFAHLVRHS